MNKSGFLNWIGSIGWGRRCLVNGSRSGLGADPDEIAKFDREAARLLRDARAAYDRLSAYLDTKQEATEVARSGL